MGGEWSVFESRAAALDLGPALPSEQFPHFPHPFTIRAASGHDPLASEVLSTVFISAERSRSVLFFLKKKVVRKKIVRSSS